MSFVEAAEVREAHRSGWVERIEHGQLRVDLLVCEDDHGELLAAVGLALVGDPESTSLADAAARLGLEQAPARPSRAGAQLREYLAGHRRAFDLRVIVDGSEFELAAWRALTTIPHGQTCSYADQAATIGRPSAARAVGRANGRNPVPIVVPCHRVIGRDGSLTGFTGGLALKRWLLAHEGAPTRPQLGLFA